MSFLIKLNGSYLYGQLREEANKIKWFLTRCKIKMIENCVKKFTKERKKTRKNCKKKGWENSVL